MDLANASKVKTMKVISITNESHTGGYIWVG